jgi:hypothetical protein
MSLTWVFYPDRSGQTTTVRFRYTGPVQPGTVQNRMNSIQIKIRSSVGLVWYTDRFDQISGEFDVFSNLN